MDGGRAAVTVVEREQTAVETRARLLEAAALELEVRGWCQQNSEDDQGRVCAIGALKAAVGIDPAASFGHEDIACVHEVWGNTDWYEPELNIVEFNDSPDRDAADVAFVLRWRAAEVRDGL